jgi:proline iminopeptidase
MHVIVNGVRLFFFVEGAKLVADGANLRERQTVILLHGGPGADHAIHQPAWSELADIAQIIYLDRRGNGRSDDGLPDRWTLDQWGDDVKDLCDALGVQKPIVIGTSFGAFVVQSYATRHPNHLGALILISTAAKFDFEAMYAAFGALGGAKAAEAARNYWSTPTVETRMRYHEVCMSLYFQTLMDPDVLSRIILKNDVALHLNGPANEQGRMDFWGALSNVTCPVLVMAGREDPVTPLSMNEGIVASLPDGAAFKVFDKCGHGVVGDRPEEAFAAIRSFIADIT